MSGEVQILVGDCIEQLAALPEGSVRCCVTSPPYWGLRDYGVEGQIGLEATLAEYVEKMVEVFRTVRRVLADDGTLWLNLGDSYQAGPRGGQSGSRGSRYERMANGRGDSPGVLRKKRADHPGVALASGLKPKDLVGMPWRVAFALQADGWWLRQEIIWAKGNPMPEAVTDRPTRCHEQVFLLTKSARYFYDAAAIAEPTTGTARPRGNGVNPKSAPRGKNEDLGAGFVGASSRVRTGFNERWRNKQNASFSAAVTDVVKTRNARSVWFINSQPYAGAHFATFPEELPRRCILAGSAAGDAVLDPFMGSGTTGAVALTLGRRFFGCELNPDYVALAEERLKVQRPLLVAGGGA